ncbi:helix-turn-helix domain-containing protein [Paenibacillus odorifer]|uniref:helix-turn-helix domain-containing protein n=1 Tax=Paenibacillus odorifer TaxID=189426 RepID=UPI00117E364C
MYHELSQINFAETIGISRGRLSEFEQEETKPSAESLNKIGIHVDLNWLVGEEVIE